MIFFKNEIVVILSNIFQRITYDLFCGESERAKEQKAILIGMKLALWCISYVWRHYFMTFRGTNSHSHEDFFREESAVLYTTNIQQNNVFFLLVNWTGPRFTQTSNIIHIISWMLGMYSTLELFQLYLTKVNYDKKKRQKVILNPFYSIVNFIIWKLWVNGIC